MIYQTIISLNLCSFILLISTILSSKLSSNKKIDIGFIFLIFSTLPIFIGGFICFIINFNFNFNLNLNFYTNIILFIFNIILAIYVFKKSKVNFKQLFHLNFKSEFRNFDKIIISIFLFLLFLIAITPLTDADSIIYHLNFAKVFFNELQYNTNILYSLIGYIEFFNILPFFLGSTNFISIHSFILFIILFFWILKNENIEKNKKFLIYLTISCPVLFYSFDGKKPFLIGIFLMTYVLLDNLTTKNTKIFSKYFILTLLPLVKLNFIIPSLLLIIYFLFLDHQKKEIKSNIIVKVMILSFITYLPLLTFKFINFHNPFAPFLYDFFPSEFSNIGINLLLDAKTYVHGSSLINETKSLFQLLNTLININKIYNTIGIGIIIILLFFIKNIKKFNNKIVIFLLLSLIVNLITTPYSPRFFLPMYLIICIFLLYSGNKMITLKNNLFLAVLKIQLVFVILMMTIFCYINMNIFLKEDMKKAVYSYDKATKLNKIFSKNQKVITGASIFYNFINIPIVNLSYSMDETDVNNFKNKILKEKFEYYVSDKEIKKFFTSKKNISLSNPLFHCFSLKDRINVKIGNKTNYFKEIFLKIDVPESDLYIYQKKKC